MRIFWSAIGKCLVSKERQVGRRRCATPHGNNRSCVVLERLALQTTGGPVTRPASVGMHERAERPRRSAPEISGTDEALPRDISLSGEHEALPAPLFACPSWAIAATHIAAKVLHSSGTGSDHASPDSHFPPHRRKGGRPEVRTAAIRRLT